MIIGIVIHITNYIFNIPGPTPGGLVGFVTLWAVAADALESDSGLVKLDSGGLRDSLDSFRTQA